MTTDIATTFKTTAVILAAGLGTRMRSKTFKVMHEIAGRPLLLHVLDTLNQLQIQEKVVVTSPEQHCVRQMTSTCCRQAIQEKALGTAHAVLSAADFIRPHAGTVLVVFGADPLLTPETLDLLVECQRNGNGIAVLAARPDNPDGLGRLVVGDDKQVVRIVEHKCLGPLELCQSEVSFGGFRDGKEALLGRGHSSVVAGD